MQRLSDDELKRICAGVVSRAGVTYVVALPTDLPPKKRLGLLANTVRKGPMTLAEKLREVKKTKLGKGTPAD